MNNKSMVILKQQPNQSRKVETGGSGRKGKAIWPLSKSTLDLLWIRR